MKSGKIVCALTLAVIVTGGCSRTRVFVPPRFDLATFARWMSDSGTRWVGLVTENGRIVTARNGRWIKRTLDGASLAQLRQRTRGAIWMRRERTDDERARVLGVER